MKKREVLEIIGALGFRFISGAGHGDENWYEGYVDGQPRKVMIDDGRDEVFDWVLKNMVQTLGIKREEFYGLCKSAAAKANVPHLKRGIAESRTAEPLGVRSTTGLAENESAG